MNVYLGVEMYKDDVYTATLFSGSFYLYFTETIDHVTGTAIRCGETQKSVFDRKYKSDFPSWISAVRKRELKTMQSYRDQAKELLSKVEWMGKLNKFQEEEK